MVENDKLIKLCPNKCLTAHVCERVGVSMPAGE